METQIQVEGMFMVKIPDGLVECHLEDQEGHRMMVL